MVNTPAQNARGVGWILALSAILPIFITHIYMVRTGEAGKGLCRWHGSTKMVDGQPWQSNAGAPNTELHWCTGGYVCLLLVPNI